MDCDLGASLAVSWGCPLVLDMWPVHRAAGGTGREPTDPAVVSCGFLEDPHLPSPPPKKTFRKQKSSVQIPSHRVQDPRRRPTHKRPLLLEGQVYSKNEDACV